MLTRAASVRSGGRRLAWNLAPYEENGLGTWYLESLLDHGFVGYCGIRPLVLNGKREVELAWHVKKTHWNRGLATEAALTSMRLGFDQFGLSRRVAIINPDNSASRRVAQKLGLVEERHLIHEGEPIVVYRAAPG